MTEDTGVVEDSGTADETGTNEDADTTDDREAFVGKITQKATLFGPEGDVLVTRVGGWPPPHLDCEIPKQLSTSNGHPR
jgi:hypothetical protein